MSLSLLILEVFLLATDNMLLALDGARKEIRVYVYLVDGLTQEEIEARYHDLLALEEVEKIEFISKEQALEEFRTDIGEDDYILATLDTNPLPASFRVTLKDVYKDQENTEIAAKQMAAFAGVEEVNYGRDFLQRFTVMTRAFLYIDIALGVIVILSSIFIISNTVRLTILSRKRSIEILKLVGATNRFITMPFVMEGAFQGAVASLMSLGLLLIIHSVLHRLVPDVAFLTTDKMALYVLTCTLLGSLGSYSAMRRFLKL
jgi:cell division transport system permease protein